jgi:ubiquinone/menaquinone biosynthesis C-methylase UbiE
LDIGGEGRHAGAWNLNPSSVKTIGADRGQPIPRHIPGRADEIPLPDHFVDRLIVERTPLRRRALAEIRRVVAPRGTVILRHAMPPGIDPHRLALEMLTGRIRRRIVRIGGQYLQETVFRNPEVLKP